MAFYENRVEHYGGALVLFQRNLFEQDGGWYVQCKYGSKALALGKGNAVFVKALKDVQDALVALRAAAEAGEIDEAIENMMKNRGKKAA